MYSTKNILLQILIEASEKGTSVGKTQLVKLLYLAEVEHYGNTGQRLTDLKWLFYHYGPYALELDKILAQPEFEKTEIRTQGNKDFILFRVAERMTPYEQKMDPKVSLLIKKIVGQWKDKPLEELLDHVYFETEPMETVKQRGDVLDFSTIKPESEIPPVIPLKASKEAEKKVAELRQRIRPFLESMGKARVEDPMPSEEHWEALKAWDEEENSGLIIPPNFVVHITKTPTDSANEGN